MTNQQPSAMQEATPYLADLTERVLFGEVWRIRRSQSATAA